MKCLYCKQEKLPSESHIIPEALCQCGPTLSNAVCKDCNNEFSKVEQPIIEGLSVLRSALGIKNKRNQLPSFVLEANFMGMTMPIRVQRPSDLEKRHLVFSRKTSQGGQKIYFLGPKEEVELQKKRYSLRNPKVKWEELPDEERQKLVYEIKIDYSVFGTQEALRLACKIVFEWMCLQKGEASLLLGQEYDDIREYIFSDSKPSYPIACVVTHSDILSGLNMPFGIHCIVTSYNFYTSEIVAIVVLFGLVAYKVVLTKRYRLFAKSLSLEFIHPQTGQIYVPKIRGQLNDPKLYGHVKEDYTPPMDAIRILSPLITRKINSSGFVRIEE